MPYLLPVRQIPSYLGQSLSSQQGLLAPNYQTPRSVQMNIGFQKQMWTSTVLSVDYVRNVGTHYLIGYDTNHVGDASHLDQNAAIHAINATLAGEPVKLGVSSRSQRRRQFANRGELLPGGGTRGQHLRFRRPRTGFGWAIPGGPSSVGVWPDARGPPAIDNGAAFPGINPLVGRNTMFFPAGRSLYSGVQVSLRSSDHQPDAGRSRRQPADFLYVIPASAAIVAGGLGDQDLLPLAADFNHPIAFFGSASQDRKNQFSLASVLDVRYGARLGLIAHFASPLPQTLFLPASDGVGGEIFRTDVTGDGAFGGQSQTGASAYGDILPGTNIGAFGRAVKADDLNTIIQTYNTNFGNRLTPAGSSRWSTPVCCRDRSWFSWVRTCACHHAGSLPRTASLAWLRTFDLTLSRPLNIGDRFVLEPSVSAFNVLNFANFDGPGNRLRVC